MRTGLWHLTNNYPGPALPAGATLVKVPGWSDLWVTGESVASNSGWKLARGYFRGLHNPQQVAAAADYYHNLGFDWQDGNEPNHPVEQYHTTPDLFALWCEDIARRALRPVRRWFAAPSPSLPGWQNWLGDPEIQRVIKEYYQGVALHIYGTREEFAATLHEYLELLPENTRWGIAEHNPGWGRPINEYGGLEYWADEDLLDNIQLVSDTGGEFFLYYCYDGYREPGQPEDLSATEQVISHLFAGIGLVGKEIQRMTGQELLSLARTTWSTHPFNADFALPKAWLEQARDGNWLGAPTSSELETANHKYVYQLFTGGALWCEKGVWKVSQGLPPFD